MLDKIKVIHRVQISTKVPRNLVNGNRVN